MSPRAALRGRDVREALAGEVPIRRVTFRGQPPTDDEIESTKDARAYIAAELKSDRDSFDRIRRTRACYRCGAPPQYCDCPDEMEPDGARARTK